MALGEGGFYGSNHLAFSLQLGCFFNDQFSYLVYKYVILFTKYIQRGSNMFSCAFKKLSPCSVLFLLQPCPGPTGLSEGLIIALFYSGVSFGISTRFCSPLSGVLSVLTLFAFAELIHSVLVFSFSK